jgi:nitric oxide reductase subunit B
LAIASVGGHFRDLFGASTPEALELRERYAFPVRATFTPEEADAVSAFFFWTAWAATTNRPGQEITYTSNWPHEPLVGNTPTGAVFMWTFLSIFVLLAGIGALVWYYAKEFDVWRQDSEPETGFAKRDFMDIAIVTPSMRATSWFFMVVVALFVAQVGLGVVTAHYAVEGQGLYGLPLSDFFPYSVTRTWHTQLAVLWIAVAWLATGLYVAPLLGGRDPKLQTAGVWFLFVSLLIIVVGSFAGEWLAINRVITDLTQNFWFGTPSVESAAIRPSSRKVSVFADPIRAARSETWCARSITAALCGIVTLAPTKPARGRAPNTSARSSGATSSGT